MLPLDDIVRHPARRAAPQADARYAAFGKELRAALAALAPAAPQPSAAAGFQRQSAVGAAQRCGAVRLRFGESGELASVGAGKASWSGSLGVFQLRLPPGQAPDSNPA